MAVAAALSRVAGLIRERYLAQYLGTSAAADAFAAALRIPLLLDGVLGERVVSSAFIPRYSRLLAEGTPAVASRLAWSVASFHLMITTGLVLAGVLLAPQLVAWIAPGRRVSPFISCVSCFPPSGSWYLARGASVS